FFDTKTPSPKTLCQLNKIWITQLQSIISKSHISLFPFDHAVCTIIEHNNDKIQSQSHRSLYVSKIHQQSSITDKTNNFFIWIEHLSSHPNTISSTHCCQC